MNNSHCSKYIRALSAAFCIASSLSAQDRISIVSETNNSAQLQLDSTTPGETLQLQSSLDLSSDSWFTIGSPFLTTSAAWQRQVDLNYPRQFFRLIPADPIFAPATWFPLDGTMLDASSNSGSLTISNGSSPTWAEGRTEHHQAFNLTGANTVNITGQGTTNQFTFSANVYLADLQGATPMIFDSGSANGNIKIYIKDNQNGTYQDKNRDVGLVFQVHGNTGGNGSVAGTVESAYRRIGEHSLDFINDTNHTRREFQIWLQLTVTYDPALNKVDFYINGMHDSTQYFTTSHHPVVNSARIGSSLNGQNPLIARISDIRLYSEAISAKAARELGDFRSDLWAIRDIDQWSFLRTFHVATNGDDANVGSEASPLKTLGAAIQKTHLLGSANAPGTRIVMHPGLYREGDITTERDGTRFNPILIEAETPGTVTLSGSEVFTDYWTSSGNGIWYSSYAHDFGRGSQNSIDHDTEVQFRRDLVFMDGEMLRPYTTLSHLQAGTDPRPGETHERGAPRITDEHAFFVDEDANRIYIRSTKNPNSSLIEVSIHNEILYNRHKKYIAVRGIKFQHASSFLSYQAALNMGRGSYFLIEDCEFSDNGSDGLLIQHGARDTVIRRSTAHRNGQAGMRFSQGSANAYIHDCVITRSNWRLDLGNYTAADPSGFGKVGRGSRFYFERVEISNNNRIGFWADIQNWDITLENCYLHDNRSCLWFEISCLNLEVINSSLYDNVNSSVHLSGESVRVVNNVIQQDRTSNSWGLLTTLNTRDEQPNMNAIYMAKNAVVRDNTFSTAGTTEGMFININSDEDQVIADTISYGGNSFYAPYAHSSVAPPNGTPHFSTGKGSGHFKSLAEVNTFYNDTTSLLLSSDPFAFSGGIIVSFDSPIAEGTESAVALEIPLSISTPVDQTITVNLTVESDTAQEGADFRVVGESTITFKPLERWRAISVLIPRDGLAEGKETFRLKLSSPSNAALGSFPTSTVTISD